MKTLKFSTAERRLLTLLPANGEPRSTTDLVTLFFEDGQQPFNARNTIVGMMRSIIRKSEAMPDLGFVARKSIRRGPRPIEFWLEPRP